MKNLNLKSGEIEGFPLIDSSIFITDDRSRPYLKSEIAVIFVCISHEKCPLPLLAITAPTQGLINTQFGNRADKNRDHRLGTKSLVLF